MVSKEYIRKNWFPIAAEIVFILSCFVLPEGTRIYANTIFYILLFMHIIFRGELSVKEWSRSVKSGRSFWSKVIITAVGFVAAVALSTFLENRFPHLDTGAIKFKVNSWPKLVCFVLSTVCLPAITEEIIFRKNLILLNSKTVLVTTTIFSMFLFSAEHFLTPWGILLGMIWALPLSLSYIKTKNIYVPITAHVILSLLGNGIDIIKLVTALI